MPDAAEILFKDESLSGDDVAVDEAIRRAGGEHAAVRALLVELVEREQVHAAAEAAASLGFRRGHQPARGVL